MTEDTQEPVEIAPEVNDSEFVSSESETVSETEAQEPAEEVNVEPDSTQESSDNEISQEEPNPELLKQHDAWVKMRKKTMRYRNEAEQAKAELAKLKEQSSVQQSVNPAQADTGAELVDPKTGRKIPLNMSYDELVSYQNGTQEQVPQNQNYNYNQPVQQQVPQKPVNSEAKPADLLCSAAKEQLSNTYKKFGEEDVVTKIKAMVSLGSLDADMINAAAITGQEVGEDGVSMIYELINNKEGKGQQELAKIADIEDKQHKTIALSNLLYSRVTEKNRRSKSNAPKQAISLPQQGNIQTKYITPEEAFRRDQEMCLKTQGRK